MTICFCSLKTLEITSLNKVYAIDNDIVSDNVPYFLEKNRKSRIKEKFSKCFGINCLENIFFLSCSYYSIDVIFKHEV